MTRRGWVLFIALSVIWGIPYLFIKIAVAELHPVVLVFLRTALAGLALLPVALARGYFRGLRAAWAWVIAFAVIELVIPWILLGFAETALSSSLTALLLAAIPMFALVASRAAGLENSIARSRWLGLGLGAAGVAAVAGLDVHSGALWAVAALMIVAIGYASAPVLVTLKLQGVHGIGVTTAAMLFTCAFYAPLAALTWPSQPGAVSIKAWVAVGILALVCSSLAFVLFFQLVAEVGPARMSVITYVNPVVAALAGVLVLNEPITAGLLIGFPLVLAGSYLATRRPAAEAVATAEVAAATGTGAAKVSSPES